MMRYFLYSLVFFVFALSSVQALDSPTVMMRERSFTLSTYYTIESANGSLGNLIKSRLSLHTCYSYYDNIGVKRSDAYLRIFSLGSLYTWGGVLDVYSPEGLRMGWIEGEILTLLPSKFSFYDADGHIVAIAYMDHDCMGFTITDPYNEAKIIASLHRIFVPEVTDHWIISMNTANSICEELLYSFGAFVIDNQGDFKEDL